MNCRINHATNRQTHMLAGMSSHFIFKGQVASISDFQYFYIYSLRILLGITSKNFIQFRVVSNMKMGYLPFNFNSLFHKPDRTGSLPGLSKSCWSSNINYWCSFRVYYKLEIQSKLKHHPSLSSFFIHIVLLNIRSYFFKSHFKMKMAHGPIFSAQNPDITCRKIQEICKMHVKLNDLLYYFGIITIRYP